MAVDKSDKVRRTVKGLPVSEGIAIAPAFLYAPQTVRVQEGLLGDVSPEEAVSSVKTALRRADGELDALIASFPPAEEEQAKIFMAHREILADEELSQSIFGKIESQRFSAEYAVYAACGEFIELLQNAGDEIIALRAADVADVRDRLVCALRGETKAALSDLKRDCIVIARDLFPSDTATMDRNHVLGIVTEVGSETSHTAILARSFHIPALVGVRDALSIVSGGAELLLDAETGELTVFPDVEQIGPGREKRARWLERQSAANAYLEKPARSKDGERIQIGLNFGADDDDIPDYVDFIGLFRTEFLYMRADRLPTEDEQFAAYCRVLEKAGTRPVTLRTLDIGGDKKLNYMTRPREENPFLGKRALRLCFDETNLFLTQLRAALRASAFGKLQIMFPMVGSIDDIRRAKAFVEQAKSELCARGEAFDEGLRLGIMIEIPSIAAAADLAAREVDFASIGTNDLCQYLFAADRMNPELTEYCQPFAPALLRVLRQIIFAFNAADKEISLCGEMAGDPRATALLAGMGLRKFSMSASSIGQVKMTISQTDVKAAQKLAEEAIAVATQAEIMELLHRHGIGK
jgi:phosphotransferase system enzyme I (PtsI)